MKKLIQFTRYAEWWEYKLVPLLAVAYATVVFININPAVLIPKIVLLLFAIINGAIYVSVINDITDIEEDAAAGKSNRMAELSRFTMYSIVAICLAIAVVFGYFIYPDKTSLFCYVMAYVVFSLYSLPPVRLKKRGIAGVFCDALGAHFFPAMLMTSHLLFITHIGTSILWYLSIGLWSLCYGLRGILWHQFYDRENDLKSGTTTYAAGMQPADFKVPEAMIFVLEMTFFCYILVLTFNIWICISLILYTLLVTIRKYAFAYKICIIITPSTPHQIIMNDYYLVLFPLAILLTFTVTYAYGWIFLILHVLLFPGKLTLIMIDSLAFAKRLRSRI